MPNQNLQFENGYALLIGIRYGQWKKPLNGTLRDVNDLYTHFTDPQKAAYKPENIIKVIEENASKEGILRAFDELTAKIEGSENASVIVYYSGHGETTNNQYFLVPYNFDLDKWKDGKKIDNEKVVFSSEFSQKIAAIKAKKCMVILDCCHSASMPVEKGINEEPPFLENFVKALDFGLEEEEKDKSLTDNIQKGSGLVILTSSQSEEKSLDVGRNGLFTEVLLESLNGKENLKKDGWVRLIDIMNYVLPEVAERAKKEHNHNQHPMFKRIENLSHEEFILCAYNIATAKGIDNNSVPDIPNSTNNIPNPPPKNKSMTYEELKEKTDEGEAAIFEVFEEIEDKIPSSQKAMFNQLRRELIDKPNNFVLTSYQARLKLFLSTIKKHLF